MEALQHCGSTVDLYMQCVKALLADGVPCPAADFERIARHVVVQRIHGARLGNGATAPEHQQASHQQEP